MRLLQASNISMQYGKVKRLDGCSLEVESREIFGLLGQNGSGKSTLIRTMLGLQTPSSGQTQFFCARSEVGFVPQQYAFFPEYTVEENVRFFSRLSDGCWPMDKILGRFELEDFKKTRAGHLSGGYKRLLNMAVTMVRPLRLLILDEPTANMDLIMRRKIMNVVRKIAADDMSVILTTHYMDEAEQYCDRIALMAAGRICATGPVREILRQHGGEYAIEAAAEDSKSLARDLEKAGFKAQVSGRKIRVAIPHGLGNEGIVQALKVYAKHKITDLTVEEPSLARAMQALVEHA